MPPSMGLEPPPSDHHRWFGRFFFGLTQETDMAIIIRKQFRDLIPPLADVERQQLEQNIVEAGSARDPLVVWATEAGDVLLDGHNRYEICTRWGLPFHAVAMQFADEEAAADWIDANQLGRRNLTPDGFKLALGRRYNRTKKKQGQHEGNQHTNLERDQIDPFPNHAKTAEKLAKEHGVSAPTVKRAGKLAEEIEADPELKEAVTQQGKTIRQARAEKAERVKAEAPPAPAPEPEKTAKDAMGKHVGAEVSALFMAADSDFRDVSKAIVALSHMLGELKHVPHGERLEHGQLDQIIADLKKFIKFGRPFTECFKCQRKLQKGCPLCHGTGWLTRNEHGRSRTNGGDAWLENR